LGNFNNFSRIKLFEKYFITSQKLNFVRADSNFKGKKTKLKMAFVLISVVFIRFSL